MYWLSQLSPGSGYFSSLFVPLMLAGSSIGVTFVPMTMAATTGMPPSEAGLASGLLNTTRQLGGALGLAVLATLSTTRTDTLLSTGDSTPAALTGGYHLAFIVAASLVAVAIGVASLVLRSGIVVEEEEEAEEPEFAYSEAA